MEKVVKIVNLHEQPSDFNYWKTKTPQERLAALEVLRQQYIQIRKMFSPDFREFVELLNAHAIR